MLDVRITVMKKIEHRDLMERFESPLPSPCPMEEGAVFVSKEALLPPGMCESAWQNLYPYVLTLACGGSRIFDDWMVDPRSAMISCNDGFRPVSFYLETIVDEKKPLDRD